MSTQFVQKKRAGYYFDSIDYCSYLISLESQHIYGKLRVLRASIGVLNVSIGHDAAELSNS